MSRSFEAIYTTRWTKNILLRNMLVRILSLRRRTFKELAEYLLDSTRDKSLSVVEIPK
jgi:hypothetical protein